MSNKRIILGQLTSYSSAVIFAQLVTMVTGILSRNYLGPAQMGIWATLQLILTYSSYSALGTSAGIARQVPFHLGKKEEDKAAEIKNLVFTYQTSLAFITSVGMLLFAAFFREKLDPSLFWGLIAASALLILQRINGIQISVLRAYKKFDVASRLTFWSAVVNLLLVALLAPTLQFMGFVIAMIFSFVFNILYCSHYFNFGFRILWNPELKKILAFAFPLMAFGFAESFFKTLDKLVIVKLLGFQELGYYTVAIMFSTFLSQIPNSFGIVMIPHFEEKYGKNENAQDILPYLEKSLSGISYAMMVLVGMAWIATPFLVAALMPEYISGILAAKYLVLASFFVALTMPYSTVIVTLRKQLFLIPLIGVVLIVSGVINVGMILLGLGISGVAAGMILSFFFYFLCFHLLTNYLFVKAGVKELSSAALLLRFGYLFLALTFLDHLPQASSEVLGLVLRMLLFFVFMTPVMISLQRGYKIFSFMGKWIPWGGSKDGYKKSPKDLSASDVFLEADAENESSNIL